MPPSMRILARGTALVLGAALVASGVVGVVLADPLVALNSFGFVGVCALSSATVFYAIGLERVGLDSARRAAATVVTVLAGAALVAGAVLVALLRQARFRIEAASVGLHTGAGLAMLAVLLAVLTVMWRHR